MLAYIARRIFYMLITLVAISMMTFIIIQLPPGDFVTAMVAQLNLQGTTVDAASMAALRARYGLDDPLYVQYWKWISNIVFAGDFGFSLEWRRPVADLLWNRLGLTFLLALVTLLFIWAISLPIGIYTAVRRHTFGDYFATFLGVIGLAIPNFLFALVLMYIGFRYFGTGIGGLFSEQYADAPWSLGKLGDLAQHLVVPTIVLGTSGTAALIRILRANLLDELSKPYVVTARAYGVEDAVLASLAETFPAINWEKQGAYFFQRVIEHGRRRAEEVREVAETVREIGLTPWSAQGTAERQAWTADLADSGVFGTKGSKEFARSPDWRTEADRILDEFKK